MARAKLLLERCNAWRGAVCLGALAAMAAGQCVAVNAAPPAASASVLISATSALAATSASVAAGLAAAARRPPAAPTSAVTAVLGKVELSSLASDHLEFSITLSLRSNRDADLSQIRFTDLRLNGLPLFAAPQAETVHLVAGQLEAMPHPLSIGVYFRDFDNLQPMEDLLATGEARVEGTLELVVGLNLAQKAVLGPLLRSMQAQVVAHFSNQIPVTLPGGEGLRAAAQAAVAAASPMVGSAGADAQGALTLLVRRRRAITAQYGAAVLPIETRFALEDGHGYHQDYRCRSLGLRIARQQLIVLRQTVRPWEFDIVMASAIEQRHLRIPAAGYDVSAGEGGEWSESGGQLRLVRLAPGGAQTVLVPGGPGLPPRVRIARPDSPGNLALLELVGAASGAPDGVKLDAANLQPLWNDLATFRYRTGEGPAWAELLFLGAGRDGDRFNLTTPLDASAFGAPLIGPAGVVGIVQSETGAISMAAALRALGLK